MFLKTQIRKKLFIVIIHMALFLVMVMIFKLVNHPTIMIVVLLILAQLIKMMNNILMINQNHGKSLRVAITIILVQNNTKFMQLNLSEEIQNKLILLL